MCNTLYLVPWNRGLKSGLKKVAETKIEMAFEQEVLVRTPIPIQNFDSTDPIICSRTQLYGAIICPHVPLGDE